MSITLLVMTDGRRDCITQTLSSLDHFVTGDITRRVIHDDSGDGDYQQWLIDMYKGDYEILCGNERLGYSGAVQRAWACLRGPERFTFHLEDDFMFNRAVDLDELEAFLDDKWWLAQIGLRRAPWGREERGFVEDLPSAYKEQHDPHHTWLEHRLYYTMTPHLYRSALRQVGWPDGEGSEIHFKDKLLKSGLPWQVSGENVRFGFWGGVEDGANAVTHIGFERMGHGY